MSIQDQLTLGEIEEFEKISGVPIDEVSLQGQLKGKIYQALTLIWGRRVNPNLTLDIVKAMTRAEADAILEVGVDPK
jgi:hypothetical protein